MRNIKLTIEYDGTHFEGWQIQPTGHRTIQGELETALKTILKESIKLIGSGRTDSGVHALGQVANFKTKSDKSLDEIKNALNANISDEIAIINTEEADKDFHAQYSPKSKAYRYRIFNRRVASPHEKNKSLFYPHKLNISFMKEEAKVLIGKHDFKSFQAVDPSKKRENTVRTIKSIIIRKKGDLIEMDITADGFLYKMVRNIVGTLLEIGSKKLEKGSMEKILMAKDRKMAGNTAKSEGLYLVNVSY